MVSSNREHRVDAGAGGPDAGCCWSFAILEKTLGRHNLDAGGDGGRGGAGGAMEKNLTKRAMHVFVANLEQGFGHHRGRGSRVFGFQQRQAAIGAGNDEVDFQALLVAEVVDLPSPTGVDLPFGQFRGDHPLVGGAGEDAAIQGGPG